MANATGSVDVAKYKPHESAFREEGSIPSSRAKRPTLHSWTDERVIAPSDGLLTRNARGKGHPGRQ